MAGEESSVGKSVPVGFFDQSGRLRSKEEIAKLDKQAESVSAKSSEQAVTTDLAGQVGGALDRIQGEFRSDANALGQVINSELDSARSARKQTRAEIRAARDLRDAIKNGADDSVIEKKQARLDDVIARGQELEKTLNDRNPEPRVKALNVGNQQLGVVRVPQTEFRAARVSASDLDSPRELNQFIRDRREVRGEVRGQLSELKGLRRGLQDTVRSVREEFSALAEEAIGSLQEAQQTAAELASTIRDAGPSVVEGAISSALNEETVTKLLS